MRRRWREVGEEEVKGSRGRGGGRKVGEEEVKGSR